MSVWQWEAFDPDGIRRVVDVLTYPSPGTAAAAAAAGMGQLMVRARPEFTRLAGWRVRAWVDGGDEAWLDADAWFPVAEGARP